MSNIKHEIDVRRNNLYSEMMDNYFSYYDSMLKAISLVGLNDEGFFCKMDGYDEAIDNAYKHLSKFCELVLAFKQAHEK